MELEFIDWLRGKLPTHPLLKIGLGDDAAVLDWSAAGELIVTVDMLNDGVDFRLGHDSPRRIGRKMLAVNLSDMAAMAAKPVAAVVALSLPREGADELARELIEGMLPLAEQFQVALAGGDTNVWHGPLVASVTVFGMPHPRGALTRSGGKPGDRLLVTGPLGGSILGHQFDFTPRVSEAWQLHTSYQLHAGIDLSDGLALDVHRLATASQCGAVLQPHLLPLSPACTTLSAQSGRSPLSHALGDGEDFELVLAVPKTEAAKLLQDQPLPTPLFEIGWLQAEAGLWQMDQHGVQTPLEVTGFRHD